MSDTVYFSFHDGINPESAARFMDSCSKAVQQYNPKRLYFIFSSSGGFVNSGVALFNYLRGLPQEVIMHNIGSIDSIANAVFLAAEKRYASSTSAFLLHGITWSFGQGATQTYNQLQETLSSLDAAEQLTAQIIGSRTKLTAEEVREFFKQGASKTPAFALEKGLIHEIKELNIPAGAPLHTIIKSGQ